VTHADVRRKALQEARASLRADILLDSNMTVPQLLERVTRSLDRMIDD